MDNQISPAKLTQKIDEICKKLGISIKWLAKTSPDKNRASKAEKKICVYNINDKGDYAAALHEIGHVISDPDAQPSNVLERLDAEVNAWKWALENYRSEFDDKCWRQLHTSLEQYTDQVLALLRAHPVNALLKEAVTNVPSLNKNVAPNLQNMPLPKKGK